MSKKNLSPRFAAALAAAQGDPAAKREWESIASQAETMQVRIVPKRVLSIDPALRNTGWAVLEKRPNTRSYRAVAYGVIRNDKKLRQSLCLAEIFRSIDEVITTYSPDSCAVEGVIFVQSLRTAITMGAARGAALVAVAKYGIEIYEYAPRKAKQAVVGSGSAQKSQVAYMIRSLLQLDEEPPPDAADALAIGMAHYQAMEAPAGLGGGAIV